MTIDSKGDCKKICMNNSSMYLSSTDQNNWILNEYITLKYLYTHERMPKLNIKKQKTHVFDTYKITESFFTTWTTRLV